MEVPMWIVLGVVFLAGCLAGALFVITIQLRDAL